MPETTLPESWWKEKRTPQPSHQNYSPTWPFTLTQNLVLLNKVTIILSNHSSNTSFHTAHQTLSRYPVESLPPNTKMENTMLCIFLDIFLELSDHRKNLDRTIIIYKAKLHCIYDHPVSRQPLEHTLNPLSRPASTILITSIFLSPMQQLQLMVTKFLVCWYLLFSNHGINQQIHHFYCKNFWKPLTFQPDR